MQDLKKRTDVDSKFLYLVVAMVCDYQLWRVKEPARLNLIADANIEGICNIVHMANVLDYYHLNNDNNDSESSSVREILKNSFLDIRMLDNELFTNNLFHFLFCAKLRSYSMGFNGDKPFQYNILHDESYPVSQYYFKQYMAGEENPREGISLTIGNNKVFPVVTAYKLTQFDETDAREIRETLQRKYDAVPGYKDAKKSQKEVDQIIAEKIRYDKEGNKNYLEKYKQLRVKRGFPYKRNYAEFLRFLQTNGHDMELGRFKININDIFNLFIPSAFS